MKVKDILESVKKTGFSSIPVSFYSGLSSIGKSFKSIGNREEDALAIVFMLLRFSVEEINKLNSRIKNQVLRETSLKLSNLAGDVFDEQEKVTRGK